MSGYRSFAVAGAAFTPHAGGSIGNYIVNALTKRPNTTVYALTRNAANKFPNGVIPRQVDYESEDSIAAALKGVDVVISGLRDGMGAQPVLAKGAKKAGAKLFIPSYVDLESVGQR